MKKSVFTYLLLLFLLLLLPLMLFSFAVIINGNRNLKEKTLSAFDDSLTNIADNIDTQFNQIYNQSADIHKLSKVSYLSLFPEQMEAYDRISAINSVRENLSAVKAGNPLIENIQIYIPALGRVLNAQGYEHGSMQIMTDGVFETLLAQRDSKSIMSFDGNYASYLITSSYINPRNLVRVTFSLPAVQNTLSLYQSMENEYLILVTPNDQILASSIALPDNLSSVSDFLSTGDFYYQGIHYQNFIKELNFTGLRLLCIIDADSVFYSASKTTLFSALILTIMLVCIFIYFEVTWHLIRHPLSLLINGFHEIESGNLNIQISEDVNTDFALLYSSFNHMVRHINQLIKQDYEQKLLLQKAELKQLQAQINPHFLYNSFFMLQRLIRCEMLTEASSLSKKLGQYFQYITRNKQEIVLLKDEYQHVKIYMDIQALRFEKKIQIFCDPLPEAYASYKIPKIILQPIVENAFNYGLINKEENGIIELSFRTDSLDNLVISIEDNGEDLSDDRLCQIQHSLECVTQSSSDTEMTALLNIYRRLLIYSGRTDHMHVSRSHLGGLQITITLEKNVCTDY